MIDFKIDQIPSASEVIELYNNCGLPRPTNDPERIAKMYANSNLVFIAWDGERLVGVARSITDWAWSTYLADLAVRKEYKASGIGRKLIEMTRDKIGEQSMLLLLSVPTAMEYYPKVGFARQKSAFIINREV